MKEVMGLLLGFLFAFNSSLLADEGMWLLPLLQKLNIDTMHSLGLKLSAEDIYSINNGSLKDAIVLFDGSCTAEIVSDEGLLLTNHHCGYESIQSHSTMQHNYLEDGFWAKNHQEELPNPDITVTFLVRIEDVSHAILKDLKDTMNESARKEKVAVLSDSIVSSAIAGTGYNASVEPMLGGNSYYLFVYEDYKDVRLVGAPPSSIGKFGFDTDNWMWPRHTGDFSVFRIYSSPDGKPARFSKNNIPYKPRHSLPVSLKGTSRNDYAMVIGYPGTTDRYMTSFEIMDLMTITNPNRIKIRGLRQDILMKDMRANEKVNIQYASKYSLSSNYWKYSIGQDEGLKRLNILDKKVKEEKDFTNWVNQDASRKQKYGEALDLIKYSIQGRARYEHTLQYIYETFISSTELISFAFKANRLYYNLLHKPSEHALIDSLARNLKAQWEGFYKDYNPATDLKVNSAVLKLYQENVSPEFHPKLYNVIKSKYRNNIDAYVQNLFARSMFADPRKMEALFRNPTAKAIKKDPAFQAIISVREMYSQAYARFHDFDNDYERGNRLYISGLMEMKPGVKFYSDANSTMRLSYGTVQDYFPRDAVHYDYQTTLEGVIEKEEPDNFEFAVPEKLKILYRNKDFGQYGTDGKMPVCFLTTNDITGGNSGSPVMDGEGNLLGLAFDGNWEAMSSNIVFEPALQRCICVDIRYVLFIIDKYAGATNLIQEMKLIR